ncbi:nuclear transport factor 2 family protein [Sciscionella sediminilitoris]|uniref:nuclear transport factor 2 family protein n=1 Tax=Sciscionella sediminilitoris TaxID=1445613 RepID=UPI0004DF890B|nr:nuclear transport factor 2 family protein [Sciscionella sp. SE31]
MAEGVHWKATEKAHPARDAARRSCALVAARDKQGWLDLFAEDAIIEDPVGPSPFDPEGKGHKGKTAIAEFWDKTIGITESMEFEFTESFAAGNEVANIGTITNYFPGGHSIAVELVSTYKVDDSGKLLSLRAFWELERLAEQYGG